jgi:hypothetical protein
MRKAGEYECLRKRKVLVENASVIIIHRWLIYELTHNYWIRFSKDIWEIYSSWIPFSIISVVNNGFKAFWLAVWLVNLRHSLLEGFFQDGGRKSFLFLLIDFGKIPKKLYNCTRHKNAENKCLSFLTIKIYQQFVWQCGTYML